MMAIQLNEYCLHHIISFLKPHDWMQLSQVCRLWKFATSKQWKKITIIDYSDALPRDIIEADVPILSAVDAVKVIFYAAPFVKTFKTDFSSSYESHPRYIIMNEQYRYKVENIKIKTLFAALAKKATQITEVLHKDFRPKAKLLKRLFNKNKITKLKIKDPASFGWYRNIPTHGIEELDVEFGMIVDDNGMSFKNQFPILKKLSIYLDGDLIAEPKAMLSKILPYVPGLKSLTLLIFPSKSYSDSYTLLEDVTKQSKLEELSIALFNIEEFESSELFLNRLPTCCPKLRVLKIVGCIDVEKSLKTLLSLPQLEIFKCELNTILPQFEVPETTILSKLSVLIYPRDASFTGFFESVKEIRQLKKLKIDFWYSVSEEKLLNLVFGVTKAAIALDKEVLVTHLDRKKRTKKVRITKSGDRKAVAIFEKRIEVLQLSLSYKNEETFIESVKAMVQSKFPLYNAIVLKKK